MAAAVSVCDDFSMTVLTKGVGAGPVVPMPRDRPLGTVCKVRLTVRGSIRRLMFAVRPAESVAVITSWRYDGYSWSGAANEPLAVPLNVCNWCVWQSDGQW